jgi:hypothetical protein
MIFSARASDGGFLALNLCVRQTRETIARTAAGNFNGE